MMRSVSLALVYLLASATSLQAQESSADDEATERARELFAEGLEMADQGDWERAVHRFRGALELREALPVRYNLATSLAEMGRLVEALEEVETILGTPEADEEMRAAATSLQEQLRPRLGELTVEVVDPTPETQVTVDGRAWAIGTPAPADPGIRVVRLLESMNELDVEEVDVPEGGVQQVTLERPRLLVETPAEPVRAGGSDDGWIWGLVVGLVVAAATAAVVTGVVLSEQGPTLSMGNFMPPVLEVD